MHMKFDMHINRFHVYFWAKLEFTITSKIVIQTLVYLHTGLKLPYFIYPPFFPWAAQLYPAPVQQSHKWISWGQGIVQGRGG